MSIVHVRRAAVLGLLIAAACGGEQSSGTTGSGGAGGVGTMTASSSSSGGGAGGSGGATTKASSSSSGGGGAGGASGCTPGTTAPCYSGPPGTENLGVCKAGTKTCQADGTFGACVGEVLPSPELCSTPVDDDCNGATNEGCVCMPGAMLACYGGPPGTENTGICKSGMKTCAADGLSFLPCMGEVQPQLENCLSPEDEDCDGTAQACTGNGQWAKRFGDAAAQSANAVANHLGGAVITGALAGSADFGGGALTSAGGNDVFVASYDYAGTFGWAKRFGDAGAQSGVDVAVDKLGNNLVIGDFAGTIDFGGGVMTSTGGSTDVFVVKLDSAGSFVWARRFGDNQAQNGRGIAVDDAGNVYVTGSFAGTINFGAGALTSAGSTDVFVAKLDPDGNHVWSKRFGDAAAQIGKAVAVDLAGNVVITGDNAGVVDFGGGALTSAGSTDVFVASLDAAGDHFWSKQFGNNVAQNAGGVAVDSVGNVLLTGSVAGNINFGGGVLTSAGGTDVYVAKFTQAGTHLWSKIFGGAAAENGRDVAVDRFGGVVVTGEISGTVNFGGGALTSAGGTDVFVIKLDPMGAHAWSHKYGDAVAQAAGGVAVDDSGVLVAGTLAGSANFGTGNLTSGGTNDAFLAKLAP